MEVDSNPVEVDSNWVEVDLNRAEVDSEYVRSGTQEVILYIG